MTNIGIDKRGNYEKRTEKKGNKRNDEAEIRLDMAHIEKNGDANQTM